MQFFVVDYYQIIVKFLFVVAPVVPVNQFILCYYQSGSYFFIPFIFSFLLEIDIIGAALQQLQHR